MNLSVRSAAVAAVVALAGVAPLAANAATSHTTHSASTAVTHQARPAAPLMLAAEGRFRQGHDLDLVGDAGVDRLGRSWMRATVVGPHGMKATLSPAADAGHLAGTIHVPAALKGTWIRLTLVAPDGKRASTIVRHA